MKNQRTRHALLMSMMSILLCVAMLIGSTFAWFTDTASTSVNKIEAGKLDVQLFYASNTTGGEGSTWTEITKDTGALQFNKASGHAGETFLWEPGCTYSLPALKIKNNGSLALKYKVLFSAVNTDEKNLQLAKVLDVTMNSNAAGTLYDVLTSTDGDGYAHGTLEGDKETDAITLSVKMRENAGNEYQGLTIGGIAITVLATQDTVEYDSTVNTYDKLAEYPVVVSETVTVASDNISNNEISKVAVKIESAAKTEASTADASVETVPVVTATLPTGVKLANNTTSVTLTVTEVTDAETLAAKTADIEIASNEAARQLDVDVSGISTENNEPITVDLFVGKGLNNVTLYHNNKSMVGVNSKDSVTNNTFYYDSGSGILTFATLSFSPFTIVYENDSRPVYKATTTAEAQALLDTVSENAIIELAEGDYGTLYLRQTLESSTKRTDLDKTDNASAYPGYYREFNNVTVKAANGAAVTCDGVKAEAGLFWCITAPASNQAGMGRANSGFISYLSLKKITIDGITFDNTGNSAVALRDNKAEDNKSTLYVNSFTVKNCKGTGTVSNTDQHFFSAGSGSNDQTFCDVENGVKGLNNLAIIGCEMTSYYQPIHFNNSSAILNGLTVSDNTFTGCINNNIQISNKENHGVFTFSNNTLVNMNGRFVRMANAQSDAVITVSNTTVTTPVKYDENGADIFKVTGVAGFKVSSSGNGDWTVKTNSDTEWTANGDTALLPSGTY